jgi:hypothetical protein
VLDKWLVVYTFLDFDPTLMPRLFEWILPLDFHNSVIRIPFFHGAIAELVFYQGFWRLRGPKIAKCRICMEEHF